MTAMSLSGNRLRRPSASIASPPTPEKATSPPVASRNARISLKPSWSPECSPATRRRAIGHPAEGASRSSPTTNSPAASAARANARDRRSARARRQRDPLELGAPGAFDRLQADRRHIETQVLAALGRLDEHARPALEAQAPGARNPRRAPASRRSPRPPRSPARGRGRRPRPGPRRRATAPRASATPWRASASASAVGVNAPSAPFRARSCGAISCDADHGDALASRRSGRRRPADGCRRRETARRSRQGA